MAHLFRDLSLGQSKREHSKSPPLSTTPAATPIAAPRISLPARPAGRRAAHRRGHPPHRLRDLRRRMPHLHLQAPHQRLCLLGPLRFAADPQELVVKLAELPGAAAIAHFGRREQDEEGAEAKIPRPGSRRSPGSGSGSGYGKPRKVATVGELMRNQMRVRESVDSRVRRALLSILAG